MTKTRQQTTFPQKPKITIVGGGIGGLTSAICLLRKGFEVEVYEAADSYKNVGGGHWLYGNALQTLHEVCPDIVKTMRSKGYKFDGFLFTDNKKREIMYKSVAPFVPSEPFAPIVLQRADIINILAAQLPKSCLHFGKRLLSLQEEHKTLEFTDGTVVSYEVLIGADGIHSPIRTKIFGNIHPNNSQQVGIWGISDKKLPDDDRHLFTELWGDGVRAGYTYVGTGEIYWFMVVRAKDMPKGDFEILDFLRDSGKDFPTDVMQLILDTEPDKIHINPLFDLPIMKKWFVKDICCIGDSAHACTPNLGQGGCQAIEDGYWLAEMLDRHENTEKAFYHFQKKRFRKARAVVLLSRWLGKIAQSKGILPRWFRNTIIRYHPVRLVESVLKWIMTLPKRYFDAPPKLQSPTNSDLHQITSKEA